MLILKLKIGERVRIDHPAGDVWVMLQKLDPEHLGGGWIGLEAPREVNIVREEVLRRESQ